MLIRVKIEWIGMDVVACEPKDVWTRERKIDQRTRARMGKVSELVCV